MAKDISLSDLYNKVGRKAFIQTEIKPINLDKW